MRTRGEGGSASNLVSAPPFFAPLFLIDRNRFFFLFFLRVPIFLFLSFVITAFTKTRHKHSQDVHSTVNGAAGRGSFFKRIFLKKVSR